LDKEKLNKINSALFPLLSLFFIASVIAIIIDVRKYQSKIDEGTKTVTVLTEIRNNFSEYLVNPSKLDLVNNQQILIDFHQKEIKSCIAEADWNKISHFITVFDFNTSKRNVQLEINHLNETIAQCRASMLGTKDKLYLRSKLIVILAALACFFALLSSILLRINRRRTEQLRQRNQELIKAREDSKVANLAKSDFLNVMSHEIRTPLNGVIGLSHILAQSNPTPEQKKHIELLQFSSENLLGLVNDILDFGKIEAGKVQLEERSFNVGKHLRKIIALLEPYAQSKNLRLHLEVYDEFKNNVLGDSTRMGQIIFNLVNNAIKFTQKGWVKVTLQLINESETDVTFKVVVTDTGIGITPEQRKQIFDKFSQADANTTRKYGGSGLGLTISQKLLEVMGSGLLLESNPEQGSEFWFQITFPKAIDSDELGELAGGKNLSFGENQKVLLVEDNKINLLILERYLSDLGLAYDSVIDGEKAVELANTNNYDLILMDLQMPIMDGYTASKKIMQAMGASKPIIIAISAANQSKLKNDIEEYGIDDYVTKPIDIEDLKQKLATYL
tara:strand:- start:16867 stop:18543 length:1677 start_codon:yes stop_codon:yes gene_type:complete